jgi:3-hydroxyisobutyrate dehydrogenase
VRGGAQVKVINNLVCGVQLAALTQALVMIERDGPDRHIHRGVSCQGAPRGPLMKSLAVRMTRNTLSAALQLVLNGERFVHAMPAASAQSLELDTDRAALAAFDRRIDAGSGDQDMAMVAEPPRRHET